MNARISVVDKDRPHLFLLRDYRDSVTIQIGVASDDWAANRGNSAGQVYELGTSPVAGAADIRQRSSFPKRARAEIASKMPMSPPTANPTANFARNCITCSRVGSMAGGSA